MKSTVIRSAKDSSGFTLIELMITMLISGVIVAAIYSAYALQQKTYSTQETVAEMQQNLRAALMIMTRDIRMAGYDPEATGNYGVISATSNKFVFTADLNDDQGVPGSGETLTYELYTPAGADVTSLRRIAGQSAIADNIEAIEFNFVLVDGTTTSDATVSGDLDNIRAVQISILSRAALKDREFTNTQQYTTASGTIWGPYNDNYRRRLLITTVNCRNMGL